MDYEDLWMALAICGVAVLTLIVLSTLGAFSYIWLTDGVYYPLPAR
jgi:hypothetical protein